MNTGDIAGHADLALGVASCKLFCDLSRRRLSHVMTYVGGGLRQGNARDETAKAQSSKRRYFVNL